MSQSSRSLAQSWGYPQHRRFVDEVRYAATRWFRDKGMTVSQKYSYILADPNDWSKNIILPEVAAYIASTAESQRASGHQFPLHKYLHHGLSSQAMLFNLVGPLLAQGDLSPLRSVIKKKGLAWPDGESRAVFEYDNRKVFNEDTGQPTSVDLVVLDAHDNPRIFVESKFVEQEFGRCSIFGAGDCSGQNPAKDLSNCYLHHIGRKYWSLVQKHEIDNGRIGEDAVCILANYYQFFREAIFAFEHQGMFLLLCDERSPVFYSDGPKGPRGIMPFLVGLLPAQLRQYVSCVTVQEFVAEIESISGHGWIAEFKVKYGLAAEQ